MADPKYANLTGIAYDQPDVYETNELPEADQIKEEPDEESEAIEHLHISVPEAFSKFKGKSVDSKHVDFSDRLGWLRRTGYDVRSGEWELVGAGEKETTFQKYQRLKCEMKNLMEEITSLQEDVSKEVPNTCVISHTETMLRQLEELRLEKTIGTGSGGNLIDPSGTEFKKLLVHLDKIGSAGGPDGEPVGVSGSAPEGQVKYQITAKPSQAQLSQTARIADLESRINRLNALVSSTPNTVKRLGVGDKSLVEAARWVAGKMAMLDQSQLEATETRVSSLLAKLDQLSERSASMSGSGDSDRDNKIAELYQLAKSTEEMSQVLPRALDRMLALESLHQQANEFSKSLSELESLYKVLSSRCESNKEALKTIEDSFNSNLKTLKANMESLDTRITSLSNRAKNKK